MSCMVASTASGCICGGDGGGGVGEADGGGDGEAEGGGDEGEGGGGDGGGEGGGSDGGGGNGGEGGGSDGGDGGGTDGDGGGGGGGGGEAEGGGGSLVGVASIKWVTGAAQRACCTPSASTVFVVMPSRTASICARVIVACVLIVMSITV